jgi:WD40 repeat protein
MKSGEVVLELAGTCDCAAFTLDGKHFVTGGIDGKLAVHDTTSGRKLMALEGHSGRVTRVAFSPDGTRIGSAGADRTIRVWDVVTGKQALSLDGDERTVNPAVAFDAKGERLVGGAIVWDAETGAQLTILKTRGRPAGYAAFSPDGRHIACAVGLETNRSRREEATML